MLVAVCMIIATTQWVRIASSEPSDVAEDGRFREQSGGGGPYTLRQNLEPARYIVYVS